MSRDSLQTNIKPKSLPEHFFNPYLIYRIPRFHFQGKWTWRNHYHDEIELLYIPKGVSNGRIQINEQVYQADFGLFLCIGANQSHSFDLNFPKPTNIYIVQISREALLTMISRNPGCEKGEIAKELEKIPLDWSGHSENFSRIMLNLSKFEELKGNNPEKNKIETAFNDTSIILHLFSLFLMHTRLRNKTHLSPMVTKIKSLLSEQIAESVSFEKIAKECGITRSHATRLFSKETGMGPHDYLNRLRIEKAKVLLHDTDMPIQRVTEECGFTDPSHFSKVFKRLVGETPRAWKKWVG